MTAMWGMNGVQGMAGMLERTGAAGMTGLVGKTVVMLPVGRNMPAKPAERRKNNGSANGSTRYRRAVMSSDGRGAAG